MYRSKVRQQGVYFVALLTSHANVSVAANWAVFPTIEVVQHYTDNLFLAGDELKKYDYIKEINPGLIIAAKANRLNLNLDYAMQNLFYQNNSEYNDTNQFLQLDANSELIKGNLFFDVLGSIGQQTISLDQSTPVDNVNIGTRTEVRTLSLAPYYVSDESGTMSTDIHYLHGITLFEDDGVSDSVTDSVAVNLASGKDFAKFNWKVSYSNINEKRKDADEVSFINGLAEARYRLYNSLSLSANFGYANNDYQSSQPIENGSYQAFGFAWRPNKIFNVDAIYGSDYQSATIDWNPTSRTNLTANWRDTNIGLNSGATWGGEFNLKTRRTTWAASYLEDTTTIQQTQILPDPIVTPDGSSDERDQGSPFGLGETDEVFVRKREQYSVNYIRAKSSLALNIFNEKRIYQDSDIEQQTNGGNGSWNLKISSKTECNIALFSEKRQFQLEQSADDYQLAEASIEWRLKRPFTASATYRYTDSRSEVETRSYTENRIIIRLSAVFSKSEQR